MEEQLALWRSQTVKLQQGHAVLANLRMDGWMHGCMDGCMDVGFCSVGCYAAVSTEVREYSLFPWQRGYTSSAVELFYIGG